MLGLIVVGQSAWVLGRHRAGDADTTAHTVEQLALAMLPGIALAVGGVSVALEFGGGLFWTLAGVVLGFWVAVVNAWVLLVEINR